MQNPARIAVVCAALLGCGEPEYATVEQEDAICGANLTWTEVNQVCWYRGDGRAALQRNYGRCVGTDALRCTYTNACRWEWQPPSLTTPSCYSREPMCPRPSTPANTATIDVVFPLPNGDMLCANATAANNYLEGTPEIVNACALRRVPDGGWARQLYDQCRAQVAEVASSVSCCVLDAGAPQDAAPIIIPPTQGSDDEPSEGSDTEPSQGSDIEPTPP
jgi:hypothetical protein